MTQFAQDLFIFELANNHQGSLAHGKRIIDAMADIAARHGIRAGAKLQYRDLDTFIHPDYRNRQDIPHIPRFQSTRLSDDAFAALVAHIRERGLVPVATPFDEVSVQKCLDHGVEILKIASCSITDWPLLEAVAGAGRPVVASTGGATLDEIDNVVSFFGNRRVALALMHCVSVYPTPNERLHMNFLAKLKRRYPDLAVGYSGHEAPDNLDVVIAAVAKGADLLERHVGVPAEGIELNQYSMAPEQTDAWVAAALRARAICGPTEDKRVSEEERESLRALSRGVYARKALTAGDEVPGDAVYFAMPRQADQLSSGEFGRYRAVYHASRDYVAGEPVREEAAVDTVDQVRQSLHDAKGMLFEARIAVGPDHQVELSHHYGLERFRDVGAIFIHVVNRAYCKKLAVVLPGQQHPPHRHRRKEETFQLLWGDLSVEHDGKAVDLEPGDTLLIEPGAWHGFASRNGAVFEEISTTDERGDSDYRDPAINRLDPMQRKTLLEEW